MVKINVLKRILVLLLFKTQQVLRIVPTSFASEIGNVCLKQPFAKLNSQPVAVLLSLHTCKHVFLSKIRLPLLVLS